MTRSALYRIAYRCGRRKLYKTEMHSDGLWLLLNSIMLLTMLAVTYHVSKRWAWSNWSFRVGIRPWASLSCRLSLVIGDWCSRLHPHTRSGGRTINTM